jgi:hypothetical protein
MVSEDTKQTTRPWSLYIFTGILHKNNILLLFVFAAAAAAVVVVITVKVMVVVNMKHI